MTSMHHLRTLGVASLLALLAGCGGGHNSVSPTVTATETSCSLGLGIYANGASSGMAISQSAPTQAVARPLQGCTITRLASAQLRLCLTHSDVTELNARLTSPVSTDLLGPLSEEIGTPEADRAFCALSGARVYVLALPTEVLASAPSLNANWTVEVIDLLNNHLGGTFVGWSVVLAGEQ